MGLSQLTISIVMIALFSIAIIGFATQFAIDNDAAISITDDSQMDSMDSNIQGNASAFNTKGESTYSSIINSTISPGSEVFQSTAPFAITPGSLTAVLTTITYTAYSKIFGTGSGFGIFFVTLLSVIAILFGFFIYKALRGIPD